MAPNGDARGIARTRHGKLVVMAIFLLIDLGLNSSLDYDKATSSTLLLGIFGLQIIIQISVFLILFLTIADTFLFRVGLLNILLKKTRTVIAFQAIYFMLTILTGVFRLNKFRKDESSYSYYLATDENFLALSNVQKVGKLMLHILNYSNAHRVSFRPTRVIVAVLYYSANLFYTTKLEDPIYYNRDAWIALIKQVLPIIH